MGAGPARLRASLLPAARPWDRGDSHLPGCCRTPPAPPAASPRYRHRVATAPSAQRRELAAKITAEGGRERRLPTATRGREWDLGQKSIPIPKAPCGQCQLLQPQRALPRWGHRHRHRHPSCSCSGSPEPGGCRTESGRRRPASGACGMPTEGSTTPCQHRQPPARARLRLGPPAQALRRSIPAQRDAALHNR